MGQVATEVVTTKHENIIISDVLWFYNYCFVCFDAVVVSLLAVLSDAMLF